MMSRSRRSCRALRRWLLLGAAGLLPAFVMDCDKAALNVQRGFFLGLGASLSGSVAQGGSDLFSGV